VIAALFSYLLLHILRFGQRASKWVATALFLTLLSAFVYFLWRFVTHGLVAFPEIADKAIPSFIEWARRYDIDVSFSNFQGLRESVIGSIAAQAKYFGSFAHFARETITQVLYVVAGIVVAISLFLNARFELGRDPHVKPNNLYSLAGAHLGQRLARFYRSFYTVIGAQVAISAINTMLTAIFALMVGLPYLPIVIGVTFLCGLLPVIGNLISNTIIIGIGFTVSPQMALSALVFLVVIHKLEYFLNSKIIGQRIRNPLWLTLLGLVIGERLMGIPGIILAPVILHYLKKETSRIEVSPDADGVEY
jgi:predicted PurR-regulated permease PerM